MQAACCRALAEKIQCRFGLSPAQLDEITGIILDYCWSREEENDEMFGYPDKNAKKEIFDMVQRCTGHRPIGHDCPPRDYDEISPEESDRRFKLREQHIDYKNGISDVGLDSKTLQEIKCMWWFKDEESGKFIGVDNRTNDFWLEEFDTFEDCEKWLMGLE